MSARKTLLPPLLQIWFLGGTGNNLPLFFNQWVPRELTEGWSDRDLNLNTHPHLVAGKVRVELNLYSHYMSSLRIQKQRVLCTFINIHLLARKLSANLYDIYHCCVYSEKTPDAGQRNCPKHVAFYSKNKFFLVQLAGFYYKNLSRFTVSGMSKKS